MEIKNKLLKYGVYLLSFWVLLSGTLSYFRHFHGVDVFIPRKIVKAFSMEALLRKYEFRDLNLPKSKILYLKSENKERVNFNLYPSRVFYKDQKSLDYVIYPKRKFDSAPENFAFETDNFWVQKR
ncbi:MAG: hypothetical protein ACPGJV_01750 [Bacteriovoracaceae bacterium]